MSRGERYQVRKQISNLFREANFVEDRQSEEGRITAMRLRHEANELNESLRRTK